MKDNSFVAPPAEPRPQSQRTIGTIQAVIGVLVLAQIFALVVSPAGDPFSMMLLQSPTLVFGFACFALGRYSRRRCEPPAAGRDK